jgi:hypothetical protein
MDVIDILIANQPCRTAVGWPYGQLFRTRPYTASSSSVSGTVTQESTIQHVKNTVVGPPGRRTPSYTRANQSGKHMD